MRFRATKAALQFQLAFRTGDPAQLRAVIESLAEVHALAKPGSAARCIAVRSLANALFVRAGSDYSVESLVAAEPVVAEAIATTPPGHMFRSAILTLGAGTAVLRSMLFQDGDAASRAIDLCDEALAATKAAGFDRAAAEHILANGYHMRYMANSDADDLRETIRRYEAFLREHPAHREAPKVLNNLSAAYSSAYELTGGDTEFSAAWDAATAALAGSCGAMRLEPAMNLALLLTKRFSVHQRKEDLEDALRLVRSVEDLPVGSIGENRAARRTAGLAQVLAATPDDPEAQRLAAELLRVVIEKFSLEEPEFALQTANLAATVSNVSAASDDVEGLREALGKLHASRDQMPPREGQRAVCTANIARTHASLYRLLKQPSDAVEARRHFADACRLAEGLAVEVGVDVAGSWLVYEQSELPSDASSLWAAAMAAIDASMGALRSQTAMVSYRARAERASPLVLEAAAALVDVGDVRGAVVALEQFRALRRVIAMTPDASLSEVGRVTATEMGQPTATPVVYVWATGAKGVMVVRGLDDRYSATSVPSMSLEAVGRQVLALYGPYERFRDATSSTRAEARHEWATALSEGGAWLWESVARYLPRGALSLVPMGLVTALPWHGAGTSANGADTWLVEPPRTIAFGTQAGTATVRRLARPFQATIIGAMPGDPSSPPFAPHEARIVQRALDATGPSHLREGPGPVESSSVLHFCGHGLLNWDEPALSTLQLGGGGVLSAREIAHLDLSAVSLVYLSACESAALRAPSADVPEGLAHAFVAAGAQCVIGSKWLVDDASSLVLAGFFYEHWLSGGVGAAEALVAAQSRMREATGTELAGWLARTAPELTELIAACAARGAERMWRHPYFWGAMSLVGRGDVAVEVQS